MRARVTIAALLAASTVALTSERALAFEKQWHLGGGVGVGGFMAEETVGTAPVLGLYGAYGVSDMFDVGLELNASNHDAGEAGGRAWVYSVAAGAAYKLDVLQWIPYVGLLAGFYYFDGPTPVGRDADFGASLTIGLDYAISRNVAMGGQLRFHFFSNELPSSIDDNALMTVLIRAEYRWGF